MLQIHTSPTRLELVQVAALPGFEFRTDWSGKPLPFSLRVVLALDPAALHLSAAANVPAACVRGEAGSFVEGLWEQDVVELFLKDDSSSAYQEFNINPAALWWSAVFSGYRSRVRIAPELKPLCIVQQLGTEGWLIAMSFPRKMLGVECAFTESSRGAVFAIIGSSPRCFCSLTSAGGSPDFHRPELLTPLRCLEL